MQERSLAIPELILIAGTRVALGAGLPLDRKSARSRCEESSRIGLAGSGRVEHDSYCDRHTGQARGSGKKGGLAPALARVLRVKASSGKLYTCPMCSINGTFC
jgi:hypothetical protein